MRRGGEEIGREMTETLDRCCARIMEGGADSVQIVATRHCSEGTVMAMRGKGNFYARVGACERFLRADDARDRAITEMAIIAEVEGSSDEGDRAADGGDA